MKLPSIYYALNQMNQKEDKDQNLKTISTSVPQ